MKIVLTAVLTVAFCLTRSPLLCAAAPAPDDSLATIAILPFADASHQGRYAPLAQAIGDMLTIRLADVEGLVIVERTAINDILGELELSASANNAQQGQLGRAVGAQFVLTGSLSSAGDTLQLSAHLVEVSTTRVAQSAQVVARADDLVNSLESLTRELLRPFRGKLPALTPEQIDPSPATSLHFMRGLGYHYAGMPEHAATEFLKTLAIEPNHAEARFYSAVNYFETAREYEHALVEFERFLREFPDHPQVQRAEEMIERCQSRLAAPPAEAMP